MTQKQCTALLAPLAILLNADVDAPTYRAYYRALQDVPLPLMGLAIERAMQQAKFFPKPAELRQWAEEARQALVAAHPYDGCLDCQDQRGWRSILVGDVPRVIRCPCFKAHQLRLAELGVAGEPLSLPAPREIVEEASS